MGDIIVAGVAIMLVIEGILPFTAPRVWREVFTKMLEMTDGQLRFMGLASMVGGLAMLALLR